MGALLFFFFTQIALARCKWARNGGQTRRRGFSGGGCSRRGGRSELNLIERFLPGLLCKLRRHAGTAAISRRMTTVVFSSGLLRLLGKRQGRARGSEGGISSPPPTFYLRLNIFVRAASQKPVSSPQWPVGSGLVLRR